MGVNEGSLQVTLLQYRHRARGDNGKWTYNINLYGTYLPVALVLFVFHTISYTCDSMSKR